MSCNCIKEKEQWAKEKIEVENIFNKPVESVKLKHRSYTIENNQLTGLVLRGVLEIELEGQKKPKTIDMRFWYCPFCGKKYEEDE